jgi:hypothetical protein
MTRSRRLGTALTLLAAAAALSIGGAAASAASVPAEDAPGAASVLTEVPQVNPQPEATRGRGGYGYPTTPPAGELPSTPPGGELPSTAPAGEVPSPIPSGVSPGHVPAGELPVTGSPLVFVAAAGGLLAVAGVGLRYAARRRRP